MDKNIAAILREDARTFGITIGADVERLVEFDGGGIPPWMQTQKPAKPGSIAYTYVSDIKLSRGDVVVVPVGDGGDLKVGVVVRVDEDLDIEPNSDIKYKWVVSKVDAAAYANNAKRNTAIERGLADIYRTNARRAFAQQLLAGADEKLLALVKGN